jgi:hypothetical protein
MTAADGIQFSVASRFCGPPGSANGGYLCGLIGTALEESVSVRLNRPVPLEVMLDLLPTGSQEWQLQHQGQALAQVRAASLSLDVPPPPTYVEALDASLHFVGLTNHPCPGCFVCGPDRAKPDGLRLFAGAAPDSAVVAAAWLPDASLAAADGKIAPEFVAAALDCPGFFSLRSTRPALLGEFTAHIDRCMHVDEPCVVIGWQLASEGRKHSVGTAVFDEDLERCGYARGVWIEPRSPAAVPA